MGGGSRSYKHSAPPEQAPYQRTSENFSSEPILHHDAELIAQDAVVFFLIVNGLFLALRA